MIGVLCRWEYVSRGNVEPRVYFLLKEREDKRQQTALVGAYLSLGAANLKTAEAQDK